MDVYHYPATSAPLATDWLQKRQTGGATNRPRLEGIPRGRGLVLRGSALRL
jgi:hypothetical protein